MHGSRKSFTERKHLRNGIRVEIQGDFRADYERQRQQLTDAKNEKQYQREIQEGILKDVREQLKKVQEQQELEPERDETVEKSRVSLAQAGITAIPFYRTVEFAKDLEESACARLEAQMQMTGMLDALVVTPEDFVKIKADHPESCRRTGRGTAIFPD